MIVGTGEGKHATVIAWVFEAVYVFRVHVDAWIRICAICVCLYVNAALVVCTCASASVYAAQ